MTTKKYQNFIGKIFTLAHHQVVVEEVIAEGITIVVSHCEVFLLMKIATVPGCFYELITIIGDNVLEFSI